MSNTNEQVVPDRAEAKQLAGATVAVSHTEAAVARGHGKLWIVVLGAVALIALGAALVAGLLPRIQQEKALQTAASEAANARPRVSVVIAKRMTADAERVLPGNALPLL